jgi:hypothetical protein
VIFCGGWRKLKSNNRVATTPVLPSKQQHSHGWLGDGKPTSMVTLPQQFIICVIASFFYPVVR